MRKILAKDGETLPVGGLIAVCANDDVTDEDIQAFVQSLGQGTAASASSAPDSTPAEDKTEQTAPVEQLSSSTVKAETSSATLKTSHSAGDYIVPASLQGYQLPDDLFITPHAQNWQKNIIWI